MKAYESLEEHFAEFYRLQEIMSVLRWDYATTMPAGAAKARSEQFATLKSLIHERVVDPKVGGWLEEIGDGEGLDEWQRANAREIRHLWTHTSSVPSELVRKRSRMETRCEMVWRTAKEDDDFDRLAPHLQQLLEVTREIATIKAEALGVDPYDALLGWYDPGMTAEKVDAVFDDLAGFLPGFLEEVLDKQARLPEPANPEGPFELERQEALARRLMEAWTFDFDHGRLDTSLHPFCGGYPEDVRITTCYKEGDFLRSTMAVLHETGHALYSRGLPKQWRTQPVGRARGMSVHESQSLFVEMQVGRSQSFVHWAAPLYREAFGGSDEAWSEANIHQLKTRVQRSLIRVDADEVTYPLHVILRYRLERELLGGDLEVEDLPQAWDESMEQLVGIRPQNDREGCMQDIHWVSGIFGYFPTYTLGALMAAQLFEAMSQEISDVEEAIEEGNFGVLREWLRENIHRRGCLKSTDALLREVTGSDLDAKYFKEHLKKRYLDEQ